MEQNGKAFIILLGSTFAFLDKVMHMDIVSKIINAVNVVTM
jgi:hypothetical protein